MLHQLVEAVTVEHRQLLDLEAAPLHPGLRGVPGGQVGAHVQPDSLGEERVEIEIRGDEVESASDVSDVGSVAAVPDVLVLLSKGGCPRYCRAVEIAFSDH